MPVPAAAWQPRISSCINIASWIRAAAAYSVQDPAGGMACVGSTRERARITYLGVTLCHDTRMSLLFATLSLHSRACKPFLDWRGKEVRMLS